MKILLADDDSVTRIAVSDMLQEWGHEVLEAPDGDSAWRVLEAETPPLALLDWVMPGIEGVALTRRLRETPRLRGTYVILLTAKTAHGDMVEAFSAGVDDFLTKPVEPEELRARLRAGERIVGMQTKLAERADLAEEQLLRTNRALRVISDSNQALLRAQDETALLERVCQIAVEVGGYRMAWVGFAEQDEAKTVRPVAQAGLVEGYLQSANFTWADTEWGRGPTGTAIRTGRPDVCRDVYAEERFAPWREEATRRGYACSLSLPLRDDGVAFGALNIYSDEPDAFSENEIELLTELADDLAHGITGLRTRAERDRAVARLRDEAGINAALLELETVLAEARGTNTVCEAAVGLVARLFPDARGFVWRWDEHHQQLVPAQVPAELRDAFLDPTDPHPQSPALAELLQGQDPLVIEDASADARLPQGIAEQLGIGSMIAMPLKAKTRLVGMMCLCRQTPGSFSDRDRELAGGAAQRIAQALAGEESRQRLETQLSRTSLFNQITQATATHTDYRSILHAVLALLEAEFGVDSARIGLFDADSGDLVVEAATATGWATAEALGLSESGRLPFPSELTDRLKEAPLYSPDNAAASSRPHAATLAARGLHSSLLLPLTVDGEPIGALMLDREEPDAFDAEEQEFLRQVADYAALAVQHARLHEDLRKAYDDLKATQDQVVQQERLRALGQMASGIAHDFNNALLPVVGYAELLTQVPGNLEDTDKAGKYLKTIHTAAKDAAAVVNRLREFYRHREKDEVFGLLDLKQLAAEALDLSQPKWRDQARAEGLQIEVDADLQPVPVISGNDAELREALTNLIFNAVDAMRMKEQEDRTGVLTLRTRATGTHSLVEIGDTGVGMTEEVRLRCLEPFFTTKGEQGTGMGLAMVYGVLQRHEAEVEIESQPGVGTTFGLLFPTATGAQGGESPDAVASDDVGPLHILAAEDEPLGREVLAEFLTSLGHTVDVAENGREGLERFAAGEYDLVMTDRAMPELNGDQLAAAVKERSPDTPVIMLTGFGQLMTDSGECPAGVDLVIGKPPTLESIRGAVARAVAGAASGAPSSE